MLIAAVGLIAYIVLHTRQNIRVAALFDAVQAGNVSKVEELLRSGLSPNQRDARWSSQTVLMHAAQQGKADVVRMLLNHGATVDARYEGFDANNGRTALMFAAQNSADVASPCLRELLARGADINHRGLGQTALIIAIQGNQSTASWYLLEKGADPNATNCFGKPALTLAIETGQFDTARHLLVKGANVNAVDQALEIATLKRKRGSRIEEIPMEWNRATNFSNTALMAAVGKTNRELVELLIKAGADVNACDKQGLTPLKLAIQTNDVELINMLKTAGARE
jgi:uncharacterized protein